MKLEEQVIEDYNAEKKALKKGIGQTKRRYWFSTYVVPPASVSTAGVLSLEYFANGQVKEGLGCLAVGVATAALGILFGKKYFHLKDMLYSEKYHLENEFLKHQKLM